MEERGDGNCSGCELSTATCTAGASFVADGSTPSLFGHLFMLLVLSVDLEKSVCSCIESISNILPVMLKYFRCFGVPPEAELFWSETVNAER